MRHLWGVLFPILIPVISCAQNFTLPLWQGEVPNYQKTDETEIRNEGDILGISKVQIPEIAVYLPAGTWHFIRP